MWTAIAYRDAMENGTAVRLYDDTTEKAFDVYEDAVLYAAYLSEKLGIGVDVYEKTTIPAGGLDIEALKRQDALNKLTPEEKALLGL